jgi:hypothetical protein
VLQGGSDPASVSVIPPVETSPEVQLPVDPVNASAPSALAEIAEELLTVPVAGVPVTFVAPVYAAEPLGGSQTLDTEWVVNPEPTTLLLFGTGLALAASRYRRRNQQRAAR